MNGKTFHPDESLAGALFSPPNASFQLYGFVDGVHGRCVDGWIFDAASPESTLAVEIHDGARLLGVARATLFRADLDAHGIGHHAFRFELPPAIFDGQVHEISARLCNSGLTLPGSPRRLTTGPLQAPAPPDALRAIAEALTLQTQLLREILDRLPPVPARQDPLLAAAKARQPGARDFIFFSIIDWDYRVQRPQHLASGLARRGYRVFYISIRFGELTAGGERFAITGQPAPGVFAVTLNCRGPAPVVYAGFDDPAQTADLAAAAAALIEDVGLQAPVCVLQLPSWLPVVQGLPGVTVIFDCLDHLAGFSGVAPRVVELERTLIEQADSVVVTSSFLGRMAGRPVEMIRNGVDTDYFARRPDDVHEPGAGPVIGYFGAIADWFDIDLVARCARRHPNWRFVLIGAVDGCDITQAAALPNVVFPGEKPYAELTRYLYAFDVCLIPFRVVDLTRATNPVKVYEYLCAGKPVVATDLPELRRLPRGLVEVTRTAAEFDRAIAACLRTNTPAAARRRAGWAGRHSWDNRARALADVAARHDPKVSVVVLCYDNLPFTSACLESLLAFSDYPDLEIICVDNASTDGTPAYLQDLARRHGSVRYIRNETNLGFAAGNNVGIRAARGDFVVLLNNDTYVTRGWVRDLIRPMRRDPAIGMTGPLTNMAGNEQKVGLSYRDMADMARVSAAFTAPRRQALYPVSCLAFFCVAISRAVLDTVGELDETYGAGYFEDDDYCKRASQAGYRLAVCDGVFVHHHHSASFGQLAEAERTQLMKRNRRIFERRWGRWVPHAYRPEPGFAEG